MPSRHIYRMFVGVVIILLVLSDPDPWPVDGLGGVVTWVVVPVFKLFKYLTIDPELHRKRGRATAFSLAVRAASLSLLGLIPFPLHIDADGMAEPTARDCDRPPGRIRQADHRQRPTMAEGRRNARAAEKSSPPMRLQTPTGERTAWQRNAGVRGPESKAELDAGEGDRAKHSRAKPLTRNLQSEDRRSVGGRSPPEVEELTARQS